MRPTSGAGNAARTELIEGTREVLAGVEPVADQFDTPLPFNLWPLIGRPGPDGHSSEETKMVRETRKILDIPDLPLIVTCVRAAVENCHCESVVVQTSRPVSPAQARDLFEQAPGIVVVDDPVNHRLPTPRNCHEYPTGRAQESRLSASRCGNAIWHWH